MSELTEAQKKECTDVFNFIDKNKDGQISIKELEYALGILGRNLKQKEYDELVKEGKSFGLERFLEICLDKVDFAKMEESMIDAFKILQSDKPGFIKKKDLIFILKSYNDKISEKDVNEIIKEANPDKDGYINIEDFAKEMLIK